VDIVEVERLWNVVMVENVNYKVEVLDTWVADLWIYGANLKCIVAPKIRGLK